jgi:hypothetical protein
VESVQPARSGGAAPKTGDAVVVTDHAGAPLVRTQTHAYSARPARC